MDNSRLLKLLQQYFENSITRKDCEELLAYLDEGDEAQISAALDQVLKQHKTSVTFTEDQQARVFNQILARTHDQHGNGNKAISRRRKLTWLRIAAMVVVIVSIGILFYVNPTSTSNIKSDLSKTHNDIFLPEKNQALLTLADGRTIVLSDSLDGVLAMESGVCIRRGDDGSIIYDISQADLKKGENKFNTFTTPKGHTYQLLLPDGTKIWLNTATSVKYPVVFDANERKISLTGEAYFNVVGDPNRPFKVEAKGSLIEVLGTQFNVSAFEDDSQMITTLLEGAVNVSKNNQNVILKPGEQAVVNDKSDEIDRSSADIRTATAWKEGYFRFNNESIESIIEKITRWYDIEEVEYHGEFTERFTGTFQRTKDVSVLFDHLEKIAPVRFEIQERRVVVMK